MEHPLPTDVIKTLNKLSPKTLELFYKRSIQEPKGTVLQAIVNGAMVTIHAEDVIEYYKQYPEKFL